MKEEVSTITPPHYIHDMQKKTYLNVFFTFYSLSSIPFFSSVFYLFVRFFSASFLISLLDISLEFPFLFRIMDSRLYAGNKMDDSFSQKGERFFFSPTKFRPLCGVSGLISRCACEGQKSRSMKRFALSYLESSFRMRRS